MVFAHLKAPAEFAEHSSQLVNRYPRTKSEENSGFFKKNQLSL